MEKVILTPRELVLPEVTTLDSEVLQAYKEGIASYGNRARKTLDVFVDRNGELAGSNCFAPLELRKYLPKGTRLATMADVERATEINPKFMNGIDVDTGLVLRTAGDSVKQNDALAKGLAKQLGKRGIKLKTPKVIYFDALDLKEGKDSAYGLVYVLNDKAKFGENIIDAPELMQDNYQFKTMDAKRISIAGEQWNITYRIRKDGLSRFFWSGHSSGIYSNLRGLASSDSYCRVVVVKIGEAGSPEFGKYLSNLQKERDRQIAEVNARYKEAEKVLRGN